MEERPLFDRNDFVPSDQDAQTAAPATGQPRLRIAQRDQVQMQTASLDDLLDQDHPARVIWQAVCQLNLDCLLSSIRAVEGHVGRDATDPRILLALWIYATVEGVASARALTKLCEYHLAYRWLCGGVTVNHRLLSEFRSQRAEQFKRVLRDTVASLMTTGLVKLQRVAQDGMRTRADAGSSSFRSRLTLEEALKQAHKQIETLERLSEEDPEELSERQQAARRRATQTRANQIAAALNRLQELERRREKQRLSKAKREAAGPPRASTTDPDAHKMKFSDGGCRPGYNVQFATDVDSGIIAGVEVSLQGSDQGLALPMFERLQADYDRTPSDYLIDGGFVKLSDIDELETRGCRVFAPVPNEKKKLQAGDDPYVREKRDTVGTATWRARMGSELAKGIYKLRCQTAEWVNAQCRNHGLRNFLVRGRQRCLSVTLLHALTHNLLTGLRLTRAG
jgi:transposase